MQDGTIVIHNSQHLGPNKRYSGRNACEESSDRRVSGSHILRPYEAGRKHQILAIVLKAIEYLSPKEPRRSRNLHMGRRQPTSGGRQHELRTPGSLHPSPGNPSILYSQLAIMCYTVIWRSLASILDWLSAAPIHRPAILHPSQLGTNLPHDTRRDLQLPTHKRQTIIPKLLPGREIVGKPQPKASLRKVLHPNVEIPVVAE